MPDQLASDPSATTRGRLIECAMRVVAECGVDAQLRERVVAASGLCAQAFDEQFDGGDALLDAVAEALSNELIAVVERTAGAFVDPARRIACGVRIYLQVASESPLFARFVASSGLTVAGPRSVLHKYLPQHLASGILSARFAEDASDTGSDLIAAMTLAAVTRIATERVPERYAEHVAATILRGLGVPAAQARRLSATELPAIELRRDSLLARAGRAA